MYYNGTRKSGHASQTGYRMRCWLSPSWEKNVGAEPKIACAKPRNQLGIIYVKAPPRHYPAWLGRAFLFVWSVVFGLWGHQESSEC
jgi:hypothetical protein